MRSWCDTGDVYCDGGNDRAVHRSYFANYTHDATNFVQQKYNESVSAGAGNSTGSSGSTPTPSGTSTGPPPTQSKPGNAASRSLLGNMGYEVLGVLFFLFFVCFFCCFLFFLLLFFF